MQRFVLRLSLALCLGWPGLAKSQFHYDSFDPEIVRLSRLVWDDSLSSESIECIQKCLRSDFSNVHSWAYIVSGVHLEDFDPIFDHSENGFDERMKEILVGAKLSIKPDSFLFANIPYQEMLQRPPRVHKFTSAEEYIVEILLIRSVKKIRAGKTVVNENMNEFVRVLDIQQKYLLEMASITKEELIEKFDSLATLSDSIQLQAISLESVFNTYRSVFINFFQNYYLPEHFYKLSLQAQVFAIQYWICNSDLLDETGRMKLIQLMSIPVADPIHNRLNFSKLLLKCVLENCSREEYQAMIEPYIDKEANAKYMEQIRKRMEMENPEMFKAPEPKKEEPSPASGNRMIRPEERVTMFENSKPAELLQYIRVNYKTDLYLKEKFIFNPVTVNLRAATQKLGNFNGNLTNKLEKELESVVSAFVDLGILRPMGCYGEATNLVIGLGKWSIPGLKKEFFNEDKERVQFASQKLIELKDKEIVNWLIRVINNSQDEEARKWRIMMLKIMRDFRENPYPNRGVSKQESDLIAREIIDPYLALIKSPVK